MRERGWCGVGMEESGLKTEQRASGLSGGALKGIAIIAMVVDHAAYALLPDYFAMPALALHMVGRITGPVMFYFIAEGYHRTRDKNRYTLRMAVFALVSYVPFILFMHGTLPNRENFLSLNVIYTLLCGLLALRARHEVKNTLLQAGLILLCCVAALPGDWSYIAVLYILVFDAFRGNFRMQALGYTAISLLQIFPYAAGMLQALLQGAPWAVAGGYLGPMLVYSALFLPLALLRFYNGRRGGGGKWLFYVFYPAHLFIIAGIRAVLAAGL